MADDSTITASDFTSAETSLSTPEPGSASASPAPVVAAAPVGEATIPPAATATVDSPSTDPAKAATVTGPIPFDVHKTALENARTKAVAEWDQQYGWAKQVNPQEFQQIQRLAAKFASGDTIGGLTELIAEARKDPAIDAQLRSLAARTLAQRTGQSAEDAEPQPDVPIQLDNGQVMHLYSAAQQAKRDAYLQRQMLAQVEQRFQPFAQTMQTLQQREAAAVQQQQVDAFVHTTYQDVATWPGMDTVESKAAVAKELAAARIDANDPREVALALNAAYRKVVLPTLHTASRQAVLNDLHRQAAASTVNPAHTSTRAPKSMDEMSIAEALQHVAAQTR